MSAVNGVNGLNGVTQQSSSFQAQLSGDFTIQTGDNGSIASKSIGARSEIDFSGGETGDIAFVAVKAGDAVLVRPLASQQEGQLEGVQEFQAFLGDGRPLPNWIKILPDGALSIENPPNGEAISLRIDATLESGEQVSHVMTIDTGTAKIANVQAGETSSGLGFQSALGEQVGKLDRHQDVLEAAFSN